MLDRLIAFPQTLVAPFVNIFEEVKETFGYMDSKEDWSILLQDAIGTAAAATGGIPSSYAVTAATQAGDYYAAQMADKIPELEQLAYQKYMNDYQMRMNDLDVVRTAEQNDYAKFLDQLEQHNADRNFAYGQHLDEIDSQTAEREEALERALMGAEYGDYRFLGKMGVTPTFTEKTGGMDLMDQLAFAEAAAKQGDSSFLKALGIIPGRDELEVEMKPETEKEPDSPETEPKTSAYSEIEADVDAMIADGADLEDILALLEEAYKDSRIGLTEEEYIKLRSRVFMKGKTR
jgi:hypothetical protein